MQSFSHVALTLSSDQLQGSARVELLRFYQKVFGWRENGRFAIPGERILIRAPSDTQYLTIRGSDQPMATSGYEHLGVLVDSLEELHAIHANASEIAKEYSDVELHPVRSLYGDTLVTFRVRFRLPLTLEVQYLQREQGVA